LKWRGEGGLGFYLFFFFIKKICYFFTLLKGEEGMVFFNEKKTFERGEGM
jgi:hypothetical protein